ncbi:MAG: peptidylprolyl isomerase [Chloroflexaceae bacterium]|nr:peptidylprolyl isomerase [Chloroflexaceae bacterium]
MSKTKQTRPKATPPPSPINVPVLITSLVVLGTFIGLGVLLAGRSGSLQAEQARTEPAPLTAPPLRNEMGEGVAPVTDTSMLDASTEATENEPVQTPLPDAAAREEHTMAYPAPPPMTIDPKKSYQATITTPRGDIVIRLRPDIAPQTVNSFVFLSREGFYNGLTWHRVIEGFMAQGGDPTGTGMGGPGYNVPAEFTDKILFDRPGLVAMARASDPDSAGSQFFITTAPTPFLNQQYTIFGEVMQGQDVVNSIPLRDPATATTPGEPMLGITITEGTSDE